MVIVDWWWDWCSDDWVLAMTRWLIDNQNKYKWRKEWWWWCVLVSQPQCGGVYCYGDFIPGPSLLLLLLIYSYLEQFDPMGCDWLPRWLFDLVGVVGIVVDFGLHTAHDLVYTPTHVWLGLVTHTRFALLDRTTHTPHTTHIHHLVLHM